MQLIEKIFTDLTQQASVFASNQIQTITFLQANNKIVSINYIVTDLYISGLNHLLCTRKAKVFSITLTPINLAINYTAHSLYRDTSKMYFILTIFQHQHVQYNFVQLLFIVNYLDAIYCKII